MSHAEVRHSQRWCGHVRVSTEEDWEEEDEDDRCSKRLTRTKQRCSLRAGTDLSAKRPNSRRLPPPGRRSHRPQFGQRVALLPSVDDHSVGLMRAILILLLSLPCLSVAARSPVESAMAERWDSLSFSYAALQSDYVVESPVFVIYRLSDGGELIAYDGDKIAARHLDVKELERIKGALLVSFDGASRQSPSHAEPNPPEIIMTLCVDQGFNRSRLEMRLKPGEKSKAFEVFAGLLRELTSAK